VILVVQVLLELLDLKEKEAYKETTVQQVTGESLEKMASKAYKERSEKEVRLNYS
jgi:hypothetical protein